MDRFVITVNRQFASHGREIAKRLSEILGVPCYDGEMIQEAAEELSIPEDVVEREEETAVRQPQPATRIPFVMTRNSSNTQNEIFEVQSEFMKRVVKKGSCVVVGRCSDYILSEEENALHIYIFAEYKARLKYCMEVLGRTEEDSRKALREIDEMRDSYSLEYSGYLAEDKEYKQRQRNHTYRCHPDRQQYHGGRGYSPVSGRSRPDEVRTAPGVNCN